MHPKRSNKQAFSLIELAVLLAISGIMAGFVLKTNQLEAYTSSKCADTTKGQLIYIQGAIERFARTNNRLPLPARRFVGTDSPTYGREAVASQLNVADGVTFGALPWQALGLPASFAGDCWGNKYTYMVTTALTDPATSNGFLDAAVEGNIARKTSSTVTGDTKIAYAVISHGPDQLGAVKLNYDDSGGAMDRKWCSGSGTLAYINCRADAAVVMDAPLNEGKDAGPVYFDDVVLAAGKPKIFGNAIYYAVGWGDNQYGQIGDGYGNVLTPKKLNSNMSFSVIKGGGNFNCGLSGGLAYCWGNNGSGQLGINTTSAGSTSPVAVLGPGGGAALTFSHIAVGSSHACGISGGLAYCWGSGYYGQIGDNTSGAGAIRLTPTAVVGPGGGAPLTFSAISISASGNHTCGLSGGLAYCWGLNNYGQVGDNTTGSPANDRKTPTAVLGPGGGASLTFTSISAGNSHSCGISGGLVYCWGYNLYGQIGNNTSGAGTNRSTPTAALGPGGGAALTFTSVVAGYFDTCGLSNGRAYCWGYNATGQIGDGTSGSPANDRKTPTVVLGPSGGTPLIYSSISAGTFHYCGLISNGTAYCWGQNGWGELGDNTSIAPRTTPVAVSGGLVFAADGLESGGYNRCGITTGGTAYCWGYNLYGQVGDTKIGRSPAPLSSYATNISAEIALGGNHTCGLATTGAAYCWGSNSNGQVGDNTSGAGVNRPAPTAVLGPGGGAALNFSKIAAGHSHSCGLTTAGAAYCWGNNSSGQLGDNTTGSPANDRKTPKAVVGPGGGAALTFSKIAAGYSHTCGLTTIGTAYCWGSNSNGQLGDGTSGPANNRLTPTAVLGPGGGGALTYSNIVAGYSHTCGLTAIGTAYCWGQNTYGQIGDNTSGAGVNRTAPTAVLGPGGGAPLTFTTISAGGTHTCGLTSSGAGYCWGQNSYGQIGDNNSGSPANDRKTPTAILGPGGGAPLAFSSLKAGYVQTCGVTTAGVAYCWGHNMYGQLGANSATVFHTTPTAVLGVGGSAAYNFQSIYTSVAGFHSFGLAQLPGGCSSSWDNNAVLASGTSRYVFQSTAPVGACVAEYRTCINGSWTGSYTQKTCTPGCDARTIIWNGVASGCTAFFTARTGGTPPIAINDTSNDIASPATGSANASCSFAGVVNITPTTCTP